MGHACEGKVKDAPNLDITSVNPAKAHKVQGTVNNSQALFVLDTGAAVTLLHKDVWDRVAAVRNVPLEPWPGQRLVGMEGTPLQVYGMVQVEFQLADEVFQHHVLVVGGLSAEVILGLDFMEENNCTIELGKTMLYFLDRKKSIGVDRQIRTNQPIKVSIGETVHLPAYSEMEMMANTSHNGEAGVWMVEEKTDKRSPIMVNPTDRPVTLHKGTQIATLDMVEAPTETEVGEVLSRGLLVKRRC